MASDLEGAHSCDLQGAVCADFLTQRRITNIIMNQVQDITFQKFLFLKFKNFKKCNNNYFIIVLKRTSTLVTTQTPSPQNHSQYQVARAHSCSISLVTPYPF